MTTLVNPFSYPLHVATWKRPAGNVEYRVTNSFDGPDFLNGGTHRATDIGNTRTGDALRAPTRCRARGRRHFDGALGVEFDLGHLNLQLWHLSRTLAHPVTPGKATAGAWVDVAQGQGIGATGATGGPLPGGAPMPAHTHAELRQNGVLIDVEPYLPMVERPALPLPAQEDDVEIPADIRRTGNRVGVIEGTRAAGIRIRRGPVTGEPIVTLPAADFPFMSIGEVARPDGTWLLVFLHPEGSTKPPVIGWVRSDFTSGLVPEQVADCTAERNALRSIRTAAAGAKQAITAIEGLAT